MSFAGFKKQINKANQYMSEKIGSAKGSKLEDDFIELERKTDATAKLVEDVLHRTKEYLQPNPAARAKLSMQGAVQKVRGEAAAFKYPQPEGTLGETMVKGGQDLGEDSLFVVNLSPVLQSTAIYYPQVQPSNSIQSIPDRSPVYAPPNEFPNLNSSMDTTLSGECEVVQEASKGESGEVPTTKKRPRSVPSGRQKGLKKFKKDMEKGRVVLNGPKRYDKDWPPPFHKTVLDMREWLINQSGQEEKWDHDQRQMLRTYYSNIFGLDSKKSGTGNIYLYFKVALLSKRCWELVKEIMKKLENGTLVTGKKQRVGRVFQTSFSCLTGIDPDKNEEAVFEILTAYDQGRLHGFNEIRERHGIKPRKATAGEFEADVEESALTDNQSGQTTELKMAEVSKQLERKKGELKTCQLEKRDLIQDRQKLLYQLKTITKERNKLASKCCDFENKINAMQKENEKLRNDAVNLKKQLKLLHVKSKEIVPSSTNQLEDLKEKCQKHKKFLNDQESWKYDGEDTSTTMPTESGKKNHGKANKTSKRKELEVPTNNKKDDENEEEINWVWDFDIANIQVDSWVAVAYDTYLSVGKVQSIQPQKKMLRINFLNNNPVDGLYSWPPREHLYDEEVKFVIMPNVEVTPKGKKYSIPEMDSLRKLYKDYKKKFM